MRSASCYTDLRKVVAYAKNKKVQYPGGVAKNWETLQAALPCNPDFTVQNYVVFSCSSNSCTGPNVPVDGGGETGPTGPNCDTWYPTYGYVIYEEHLDVYPLGPVYFWCNSSGVTEEPPVAAPDYSTITNTATRCGEEFSVLGDLTGGGGGGSGPSGPT